MHAWLIHSRQSFQITSNSGGVIVFWMCFNLATCALCWKSLESTRQSALHHHFLTKDGISLASFTASVDALAGTQSFELALITSDTDWRSCGALLAGTVLAGTHSTSNAVEVEVVGSCLVPGLQLHCVHEYQMET